MTQSTNPLIQAHLERSFHTDLIATASRSEISTATRWAVEHNAAQLMLALRPHSKFKTKGGAHALACRAVTCGSLAILEHLRGNITSQIIAEHDYSIIKDALSSSSVVGIRWLIKHRHSFGLSNDHFAHGLCAHCLIAHPAVVDFLHNTFPQQKFEWLKMAEHSVVHHQLDQCLMFLKQCTSANPIKHIMRVIQATVRCSDPTLFSNVFNAIEQLVSSDMERVVNIPELFKIAVERDHNPQGAIGALVSYFGTHVDCRSLGDTIVNKIETHKCANLANTIMGVLGDIERPTTKIHKI